MTEQVKLKKQVSAKEYEKQVEIESANLQHYNYMSKGDADKAAREVIKELYEIV